MLNKNKTLTDLIFIFILTFIAFCLYGVPAFYSPDESRYAEVTREMMANKDYIVPFINGIIFFHKPPVVYWITAFFMHVFGENTWGARLVNPLLVYCCLNLLYFAVKIVLNSRSLALLSVVITCTTVMFMFAGRYLNMDLAIAVFLNMTMLCYWVSLKYDDDYFKSSLWLFFAFIFAGISVMTKGLMGIVFPVAIVGIYSVLMLDFKRLFDIRLYIGLVIVAIVSVPWILAVNARYPDFAWYYIMVEQVLRYATDEQKRQVLKITYIGVFMLGFFPWWGFILQVIAKFFTKKEFKQRQDNKPLWFLFIWGTFVFLFFFMSKSFLFLYLAPVVMPFCILISQYIKELQFKKFNILDKIGVWFTWIIITGFSLACVVIMLLPLSRPFIVQLSYSLVPLFIISIGLGFYSFNAVKKYDIKSLVIFFTLGAIAIVNLGFIAGEYLSRKDVRIFANEINKISKQYPDLTVYSFNYFYEIPFYTKNTTVTIGGGGQLAPVVGFKNSGADEHLISYDDFITKWQDTQHLSVVAINNRTIDSFKEKIRAEDFYIIQQTPLNSLVSNKKITVI